MSFFSCGSWNWTFDWKHICPFFTWYDGFGADQCCEVASRKLGVKCSLSLIKCYITCFDFMGSLVSLTGVMYFWDYLKICFMCWDFISQTCISNLVSRRGNYFTFFVVFVVKSRGKLNKMFEHGAENLWIVLPHFVRLEKICLLSFVGVLR